MKKIFYSFAALLFLSMQAQAQIDGTGYDHGNGGDACEKRFQEVAADIQSWITKGGAVNLTLPANVTAQAYNFGMLSKLETGKVSCVDEKLFIQGAEKTCINFTDSKGDDRIYCNSDRFMGTPDTDQYVLVHHEYAGLAGFETNSGEASKYEISDQISAYLENEIIKKLAVKPAPNLEKNPFDPGTCTDANMTSSEVYNAFAAKKSAVVAAFSIYSRERWCSEELKGCTEWKSIQNQITYNGSDARKYMTIPDNGTMNYLMPVYVDPMVTFSTAQDYGMGLSLTCKLGGDEAVCSVSSTPYMQSVGEAKGTIGAHCARLQFRQGFFADRAFFDSELIFSHSSESGPIPNAPWIERESVIISRY